MALLDTPLEYGLLAPSLTLFETLLPVHPHGQVERPQCRKGPGHKRSAVFSGVHGRVPACAGRGQGSGEAGGWKLPNAYLLRQSHSPQPQTED